MSLFLIFQFNILLAFLESAIISGISPFLRGKMFTLISLFVIFEIYISHSLSDNLVSRDVMRACCSQNPAAVYSGLVRSGRCWLTDLSPFGDATLPGTNEVTWSDCWFRRSLLHAQRWRFPRLMIVVIGATSGDILFFLGGRPPNACRLAQPTLASKSTFRKHL